MGWAFQNIFLVLAFFVQFFLGFVIFRHKLYQISENMTSWNEELMEAARRGDTISVKECLDNGADVNYKGGVLGRTVLYLAAWGGHRDMTELLISQGADVNIMDDRCWTLLHYAAMTGDRDMIEMVLSHGADVNIKGNTGRTGLHEAAYRGDINIIEMLISHGANVNIKDDLRWTRLHLAAWVGNSGITELLISHRADVNIKDDDGATPYDYVKIEEIKKLLKAAEDSTNKGLPVELFQMNKESANVFTDLLKEDSYELFELRPMLHGEQGTGKSTIARFLIGKSPTKFRISTNGIELYTGLSFLMMKQMPGLMASKVLQLKT